MVNTGRGLSISGALLACVAFFMPWVLVSCDEQTTPLNGWQIAVGSPVPFMGIPARPLLLLALLCAAATLHIVGMGIIRGVATARSANTQIVLAVIPLLIIWAHLSDRNALEGTITQYLPGFWLTVTGYTLALAGGIFSRVAARAGPVSAGSPS